jgi:predicted transposase/invertase (TIGR01784 family)
MFKLLFERPENAAELYYALTGIKCSPDEIQIITLSNIVSGRLRNDLAFVVRGRALVVGEHQSTHNPNMPLRMLMYLGQLYDKWIKMQGEEKFIYRRSPYKIPTPEFVVFYNGVEDMPEMGVLRISDAFEFDQDKKLGFLELEVPVYNINKGINSELLSKSEQLRQYSEFGAKLRELQKIYDFNAAVKGTVDFCIANDILAEFLKEMGGSMMSVLATEYNFDTHMKYYREEVREEAIEEITLEHIKRMLGKDVPIQVIAEVTGFDESVIRQIKNEMN